MAQPRITPNKREILYVQDSAGGANASATYLTATSHALDVNVVSGGGAGGTQYQELATTSPATGTLALGRYQTSLPTLTNGQMYEPMLDSSSRLFVNVANATLAVTQSGNWSSRTQDGAGNLITSSTSNTARGLDAAIIDGSGNNLGKMGVVGESNTFMDLIAGPLIYTREAGTGASAVAHSLRSNSSGSLLVVAAAQPGVDIGDVTINNAVGASAVNIQDGGNSITVDYATTGSGTATGALRVELPTNGTGVIATVGAVTAITNALPAGTNAIGKLAANSGVDIGDVDVTSIAAGTNNIGQVSVAPQTANGLLVFNATSSDGATALTNTAQAIKASAGQLYGWYIYNPNATAQFVQLYNTAAAGVTVGTTNPLFMLTIPATSAANVEFTNGITFSNAGWSCAATSTAGGNGAPGTALDAVFMYK